MRILVCGGRDFTDEAHVHRELDFIDDDVCYISSLIEGGATGVDRFARNWAIKRKRPYKTFHANWTKYGKKAGYIRNAEMLKKGVPDLVIAFKGGAGTKMMIELAEKAGVLVERC